MVLEKIENDWESIIGRLGSSLRGSDPSPVPSLPSYALEFLSIRNARHFSNPPRMVVLNGPAGAGKSTVGKMLDGFGVQRIARVTDRPPRTGEVNGKDYYFVDGAEFQKLDSEKKIFAAKETYGLHRGFLKSSFERIGHASSEEIFYLEGDSSLTAFSEAESVLGLSSKDLLHVFLITPSFKELLSRVSIQFSAGHFAKDEMDVRLAEGVKYLSKSEERLSNFPRSIYLVNDEVERIESVLRALVTPGGYQSLVLELEEPGAPRRISTKVASHKADALHDIAVLYLFDKDGKLLLQKRADNGKWDHSVGGHMLPGESAQEAIVREAEEELGITQLSCESVLQDFRPEPSFTKSRKHRFNVFKASFDESVLNLSDETTETERFSPEDLREKMKENPDLFEEGLLATFPELK